MDESAPKWVIEALLRTAEIRDFAERSNARTAVCEMWEKSRKAKAPGWRTRGQATTWDFDEDGFDDEEEGVW